MSGSRPIVAALAVLGALLAAAPATAAPTDSPILIRSLDAGTPAAPASEYVMLQMTVDGQEDVSGETLDFYGADGTASASFELGGASLVGEAQRTILLATPEAAASLPSPNLVLDTGDAIDPLGGAVCVSGDYPPDCVAWGSFPEGAGLALPDPQSDRAQQILGNEGLGRRITAPCATWLDPLDDVIGGDFVDGVGMSEPPPSPRSNAGSVTETPCLLDTGWNATPGNPTNDTTPTFAFGEVPPEYGASFECRFSPGSSVSDGEAWDTCPPAGNTFGPLADGAYSFQARTIGYAGVDPTPLSWSFDVDTVPPQTSIVSTPGPVSSGFAASFAFVSSEQHSTFRCQLDNGPNQACESGKTYFFLADGHHTFRVWASDQATNRDPTPAEHVFFVDSSFGDVFAPFTEITSAPPRVSQNPRAGFTYASNEPGSQFQCRVDSQAFAPCDRAGIAYPGFANGAHVFQVRAIDRAGNVDPTPAAHSWTVKGPVPQTRILAGPPGVIRVSAKPRRCKAKRSAKAKRRCRRANRRAAGVRVAFRLRSSLAGSRFACRLDKRPFRGCRELARFRAGPGRHRFEAYAIDALGNRDTSPARRIFRVIRRGAGGKGVFAKPRSRGRQR